MIHITDNETSRIRAAIDFLREGKAISILDYDLYLLPTGDVKVYVPTQLKPENVKEENAREEIDEARNWLSDHLPELGALGDFLLHRRFVFELTVDDGKNVASLGYHSVPRIS